ncbi:MAG: galactokinase [Bacteroidetes bacterium]|nr:galactokinase [Bacteroidota bacterium]
MNYDKIIALFKDKFDQEPLVIRAPGRINLLGEHTDYNKGFVLPAAIDKAIYIAISENCSSQSHLIAADLNDELFFDINTFEKSEKGWTNYILGVIKQIRNSAVTIKNFNAVFGGDIPIGAGLSSSAAIETGFLFALNKLNNLDLDKLEIAKLSQKAENEFVGVKCGIMDQFASLYGQNNAVIKIDCRNLEFEYFPLVFDDITILLCDTGISHSLANSKYNARREQCEMGVSIINKSNGRIESLRDVTLQMLDSHKSELPEIIYRRCSYVIRENSRVLEACDYLLENDLTSFGKLMYQTHEGLRDDFEVSCKELNFLVDEARKLKGVLGARMMGGGFGGCTINIVQNNEINGVMETLKHKYRNEFGIDLKIYITSIEGGTNEINQTVNKITINET